MRFENWGIDSLKNLGVGFRVERRRVSGELGLPSILYQVIVKSFRQATALGSSMFFFHGWPVLGFRV